MEMEVKMRWETLKLELKRELEPGAKGKGFVWSGKSFDSHGVDNPSRNRNKVLWANIGLAKELTWVFGKMEKFQGNFGQPNSFGSSFLSTELECMPCPPCS